MGLRTKVLLASTKYKSYLFYAPYPSASKMEAGEAQLILFSKKNKSSSEAKFLAVGRKRRYTGTHTWSTGTYLSGTYLEYLYSKTTSWRKSA